MMYENTNLFGATAIESTMGQSIVDSQRHMSASSFTSSNSGTMNLFNNSIISGQNSTQDLTNNQSTMLEMFQTTISKTSASDSSSSSSAAASNNYYYVSNSQVSSGSGTFPFNNQQVSLTGKDQLSSTPSTQRRDIKGNINTFGNIATRDSPSASCVSPCDCAIQDCESQRMDEYSIGYIDQNPFLSGNVNSSIDELLENPPSIISNQEISAPACSSYEMMTSPVLVDFGTVQEDLQNLTPVSNSSEKDPSSMVRTGFMIDDQCNTFNNVQLSARSKSSQASSFYRNKPSVKLFEPTQSTNGVAVQNQSLSASQKDILDHMELQQRQQQQKSYFTMTPAPMMATSQSQPFNEKQSLQTYGMVRGQSGNDEKSRRPPPLPSPITPALYQQSTTSNGSLQQSNNLMNSGTNVNINDNTNIQARNYFEAQNESKRAYFNYLIEEQKNRIKRASNKEMGQPMKNPVTYVNNTSFMVSPPILSKLPVNLKIDTNVNQGNPSVQTSTTLTSPPAATFGISGITNNATDNSRPLTHSPLEASVNYQLNASYGAPSPFYQLSDAYNNSKRDSGINVDMKSALSAYPTPMNEGTISFYPTAMSQSSGTQSAGTCDSSSTFGQANLQSPTIGSATFNGKDNSSYIGSPTSEITDAQHDFANLSLSPAGNFAVTPNGTSAVSSVPCYLGFQNSDSTNVQYCRVPEQSGQVQTINPMCISSFDPYTQRKTTEGFVNNMSPVVPASISLTRDVSNNSTSDCFEYSGFKTMAIDRASSGSSKNSEKVSTKRARTPASKSDLKSSSPVTRTVKTEPSTSNNHNLRKRTPTVYSESQSNTKRNVKGSHGDESASTKRSRRNKQHASPLDKMSNDQVQALKATIGSSNNVAVQFITKEKSSTNKNKKSAIPRPMNKFLIYRKEMHESIVKVNPTLCNNDVSKIIAEKWRNEPESVKDRYFQLAEEAKLLHMIQYPEYKFKPRKVKPKRKKRKNM